MKSIKFVFLIVIALIFFCLAFLLPHIQEDGLANFAGQERKFAQSALFEAENFFDNPWEKLMIQKLQVKKVTLKEGSRSCSVFDPQQKQDVVLSNKYQTVVQAKTFFSLPFAKVRVYCAGKIERF